MGRKSEPLGTSPSIDMFLLPQHCISVSVFSRASQNFRIYTKKEAFSLCLPERFSPRELDEALDLVRPVLAVVPPIAAILLRDALLRPAVPVVDREDLVEVELETLELVLLARHLVVVVPHARHAEQRAVEELARLQHLVLHAERVGGVVLRRLGGGLERLGREGSERRERRERGGGEMLVLMIDLAGNLKFGRLRALRRD